MQAVVLQNSFGRELAVNELIMVAGGGCNWKDFGKATVGGAIATGTAGAIAGAAFGPGALAGGAVGAAGGAVGGALAYGATCGW